MDRQSKFLDKQYLESRLREIKEIRRKEVWFEIQDSNRVFSKSLYICFFTPSSDGKSFKNHTLRVSDHVQADCPHSQFIIAPDEFMTKKKKEQFMRLAENSVKKALTRHFYKELDKISKGIEKSPLE